MNANVLQTDLTGKVAVVTGAGGILCGHMAKALARAGAKVALVNRSEEAINQYAAEIRVEGGIAKAYKGNVLVKADMERIANQVLEDFGPCDILINGAKAAVSNFTQWLAVHFSRANIRVNAIAPGFFSSKQNHKLLWNEDGTPTARAQKILNGTPMGRFGRTEELEGSLLFLLDDKAAGFITGVVIPVDGRFSAYSGV